MDLLDVQGTLRVFSNTTVQKHLPCSAFFTVLLSHPYMTTGKTIALTRRSFVGKVMSLLLNMLCRFVIPFFSKEQASFNFMVAVTICSDFGAQIKSVTVSIVSPSICHEVMGPDAMILVF